MIYHSGPGQPPEPRAYRKEVLYMPTMTVDYRVVLLVMGLICLAIGLVLLTRLLLKKRTYSATVNARLIGYEDVYETTKEGTQTISQRVFYPIFVYEVNGVSYKKSTAKQFFEPDERPTDIDVPIRYNPREPSDCYITYMEFPMLTPSLIIAVGAIVTIIGLVMVF